MRAIEVIEADLNRITGCMYNRHQCNNDCDKCDYLNYTKHYFKLKTENYNAHKDKEKRQSIIIGIDTDRLEQICKAEREGRYYIIPCKVGDIIYAWSAFGNTIVPYTVEMIHISDKDIIQFDCNWYSYCECMEDCEFELSDFNKTVFTTKQAADKALMEMEGGK